MARFALALLIPELARVLYGVQGNAGEPRSQLLLQPCSWPACAQVWKLREQGEPCLSSWSQSGLRPRGLEGEAHVGGFYPQPALAVGILGKPHPRYERGCGGQKRQENTHPWLFRECPVDGGQANAPNHLTWAPAVRPPLTRAPWVVKHRPVQPVPGPPGAGDDRWTALRG